MSHARLFDPETSHEAAAAIKPALGKTCAEVLAVVSRLGTATADDVCAALPGSQRSVVSGRLTDLAATRKDAIRLGLTPLIASSSTRENHRGRKVAAYHLTTEGARMMQLLDPEAR